MLSSRCASYVFGMWWCSSLHIPHPPPFTMSTCVCRTVPSVAGCPGARCPWLTPRVLQYVIMSSIVLASIYGMLGSQYVHRYLALATNRSLASSMHCLWAGFTEAAGRSHAYANSAAGAKGYTGSVVHSDTYLYRLKHCVC